uniref:Uncharacterized protein n=1 Tax=Rhizophora mucronata TaxID=61149 RepID=A0A2P2K2K5_RHIMU
MPFIKGTKYLFTVCKQSFVLEATVLKQQGSSMSYVQCHLS